MLDHYLKIFKVLSDKTRLKLIVSLNKEPMYVELISERLGVNASTVSFHLKKLEDIGLVYSEKEQYYVMYHLKKELLDINILNAISNISLKSGNQEEREQAYHDKILSNFFTIDKKLKSIPVQRKKREIILKEIAKAFELGKEYTEKEVNLIISDFHDDFCTLRREFIMNKMFHRENGIYTRLK